MVSRGHKVASEGPTMVSREPMVAFGGPIVDGMNLKIKASYRGGLGSKFSF